MDSHLKNTYNYYKAALETFTCSILNMSKGKKALCLVFT